MGIQKKRPPKIRLKNPVFFHLFRKLKAQSPTGIPPASEEEEKNNLPQIQGVTHGTSTVAATT
ncbi:MAG: hypothetical protein Q8J86_00195 [Desulfurivibrionaceae bacterium]|jgi:hypothetical protein|nr:hypothetical protein [Desulfurivibrionaceae bacterium]